VIISLMLKMSQRTYLLKMGRVAYEGSSAALLDGDDVPNVVTALMEAANDLVKQYKITRAEAEYLAYAHAYPAQEV